MKPQNAIQLSLNGKLPWSFYLELIRNADKSGVCHLNKHLSRACLANIFTEIISTFPLDEFPTVRLKQKHKFVLTPQGLLIRTILREFG